MASRKKKRDQGLRKKRTGWACYYRDPHTGKQVQEHGGTKEEARELRARRLREIEVGTWIHPREREALAGEKLAEWSERWLRERRALPRPPKTVGDDEARMRDHVLPELGEVVLEELTDRHLRALLRSLRTKTSETTGKKLGRNTVANVWGTVTKCLADAERDMKRRGVPWINPVDTMDPAEKPRRVKRPRGYYRRAEVEALISDERVPLDRRTFWGILFLAGMRHDEAAELRWGDIDFEATPRARITLARQVSGTLKEDRHDEGLVRLIPVHDALAELLDRWRREGWPATFARAPQAGDLVVPAERHAKAHRPKRSSLKQIRRDAEAVGVPRRTVHETRSSFLTLCSEDSPELEHVVKLMTHQPSGGPASETYMRTRWLAKCRAIEAFDVRLDRRAPVVGRIPRAAAAGAHADPRADPGGTEAKSPDKIGAFWRSGRDSNPLQKPEAPGKPAKAPPGPSSDDAVIVGESGGGLPHADQGQQLHCPECAEPLQAGARRCPTCLIGLARS